MASSIFPTAKSGIFIPSLWQLPAEQFTREYADLHYLKFPLGQGSQTLPSNLTVSGTTTTANLTATGVSSVFNTNKLYITSSYTALNSSSGTTNYTVPSVGNAFYGRDAGFSYTGGLGANCGFGQDSTLKNLTTGFSNTAMGSGALRDATTPNNNTAIGRFAGYSITTGNNNTFIGADATANSTNLNNSTAIGYGAITTASNQIMLGTVSETVVCPNTVTATGLITANGGLKTGSSSVLTSQGTTAIFNTSKLYIYDNGSGSSNSVLNTSSGTTNYTGTNNAFFGRQAGYSFTSGAGNCGFGEFETLINLTIGSGNSAMGTGALKAITTENSNTAFGYDAGGTLTGGNNNTFIGAYSNTDGGVYSNSTAIGYFAITTASHQIMLGTGSETVVCPNTITATGLITANGGLTTGSSSVLTSSGTTAIFNTSKLYITSSNTVLNSSSGTTNYSLSNFGNAFYGKDAGFSYTGGGIGGNSGFGQEGTLANLTTGYFNTAIGNSALSSIVTENYNTACGFSAGKNTLGSYNTFIGSYADNTNTTSTRSTAIGYNAKTTASNQIMLGTVTETVVCPNTVTATGLITANGGLTTGSSSVLTSQGTTTLTGATTATGLVTANGGLTTGGASVLTSAGTTTLTGVTTATGLVTANGGVNTTTIALSYSTLPTFTSTQIGYTASYSLPTLVAGTGNRNTTTTSLAIPIGVYSCTLFYQIDITFPTTTRTIIEFLVSSGATLVNTARQGFVYAPAIQEYDYFNFPAILKVTANPSVYYSNLTTAGGNCTLTSGQFCLVRIA